MPAGQGTPPAGSLTVLSELPYPVPMGGMTALFFKVIPLMVIGKKRCGNCIHAFIAMIFDNILRDIEY